MGGGRRDQNDVPIRFHTTRQAEKKAQQLTGTGRMISPTQRNVTTPTLLMTEGQRLPNPSLPERSTLSIALSLNPGAHRKLLKRPVAVLRHRMPEKLTTVLHCPPGHLVSAMVFSIPGTHHARKERTRPPGRDPSCRARPRRSP